MAKPCPSCGTFNFNNASKCKNCNYIYEDTIKCPNCGASNLSSWKQCIQCRSIIQSVSDPISSVQKATTEKTQTTIKKTTSNIDSNSEILSFKKIIFEFISVQNKS